MDIFKVDLANGFGKQALKILPAIIITIMYDDVKLAAHKKITLYILCGIE
jgi:hypothetical protein